MQETQNSIPYPQIKSWMHKRCDVPTVSLQSKQEIWARQPAKIQVADAILSRLMIRGGLLKGNMKWVSIKILARVFKLYFRILHSFKVKGLEKIPKSGCIFYLNHPGSLDPFVLLAALPFPFCAFVSWGDGWFSDMYERIYGFSSRRELPREVMIEKMIRTILCRNRYFAIWPEGHPTRYGLVLQGFSSFVRVYATLNNTKDRIPFMPVTIRGSGGYVYDLKPHIRPISLYFHDPIFIERKWIQKPEAGGKSPREITDYLMQHLARLNGQKKFYENDRLSRRRQRRYHYK